MLKALFSRGLAILSLAVGLAGCAESALPGPAPSEIDPPRGYNGDDIPVRILGANFYLPAAFDLGGDGEFQIGRQYTATLKSENAQPGAAGVELLDVVRVKSGELTALVPAGIDSGRYDLEVISPNGLSGSAPGVYTASDHRPPRLISVAPADLVNDADETLRINGSEFLDGIEIWLNEEPLVVVSVVPDSIEATVPAGLPVGPYDLLAQNPDDQDDRLDDAVTIHAPASLEGSVAVPPEPTRLGDPFSLTLVVVNQGETSALSVTVSEPLPSGTGAVEKIDGPAVDPVDLLPGAEKEFAWTYRGTSVGQANFEVEATGSNQYSNRALATGDLQSEAVQLVNCFQSSECENPTPICSPEGECRACESSEECQALAAGLAYCDLAEGSCQQCGGNQDCGDALPYCVPGANVCTECLEDLHCDDGNLCTDDICQSNACVYLNNSSPCDDGLFCTAFDVCADGICGGAGDPCLSGPECANVCDEANDTCSLPALTPCTNDGNDCTDDECDGLGACIHPDNSQPCDDGLFCTVVDACSGGLCTGSGDACPGLFCDESTDQCLNCETDGDCQDGVYCNGADSCQAGACVHAGDPCLAGPECADVCDEGNDTCILPAGEPCLDDGNECTDDECDGLGACIHPDNSQACDDGNFCTAVDACSGGTCSGSGDTCPGQFCNESADQCEDGVVIEDPVGDGGTFSFVFRYHDKIWVGPREDGTGAVYMNLDGSSPQAVDFSFTKDITGNKHDNSQLPPFPSIGRIGCQKDTYECGPDNEDGRGLFGAGLFAGEEWLVVAGARVGSDIDYVYMTRDFGAAVDFSFVDLSPNLGGGTEGISAMHLFGDRLYLGFPDTGGSRPYFLIVFRPPDPPGLDCVCNGGGNCEPANHDACDMGGDKLPDIESQSAGSSIIDVIWDYNDRLYVANNDGIARSTQVAPLDADDFPGHWKGATPDAADYTGLLSIATDQTANLVPSDKAVPAMANFRGRLFFARNTEIGPQLWACTPDTQSGPPPNTAEDCDPGDWQLVAPNLAGDARLTQFENTENSHLTFLAATDSHLYLGFDNQTDGIVIFRTASPTAADRDDFEGQGGCSAALHPAGCPGIGGNGLGDAANSRIFSYVVVDVSGTDYLYLITGDGLAACKLFAFGI